MGESSRAPEVVLPHPRALSPPTSMFLCCSFMHVKVPGGEVVYRDPCVVERITVKSGRLWSHTAWFSLSALIAVFGAVESLVP